MDWGRVVFFWAEVAQNFSRNILMALTAVGTVAVLIVLLGSVLLGRGAFDNIMRGVLNQLTINVYLRDDASPSDVSALEDRLKADPRVDSVRYVPKRQAMLDLRKQLRGQMNLDLINTNPLPNTLVLHCFVAGDVPIVAAEIERLPGVERVKYASSVTGKLLRLEAVFGTVGVAVVALLLLATVLIIYNTIRLTVFARQREIAIMQLVGATRWTVRWPFVFEGMLSGMAGAALGVGVLWIGYHYLAPKIALNLPFVPMKLPPVPPGSLALELLAAGALIGMLSSFVSVSRHLQAV